MKDTGIGMAPEDLVQLFEPYQQQHGDSRKFGGTGLGLWISRQMAQSMGGTLEATSRKDYGSEFTVTLRVQKAATFLSSLHSHGVEQKRIKTFVVADAVSAIIIKASLATIKQRAVILETREEVERSIEKLKRSRSLLFLVKDEMVPELGHVIEQYKHQVAFVLLRQSELLLESQRENSLSEAVSNFEYVFYLPFRQRDLKMINDLFFKANLMETGPG